MPLLSPAARKRRRSLLGFTLIELIVVIVIMGILVAVGAFAYNSVIDNGRKSGSRATAEQFARTAQGLSAAQQVTAAALDADARAKAAQDVTGGGGSLTWTAGSPHAEVVKDGYCTPVTFATSVGVKATLGETVQGTSCPSSGTPTDPGAGGASPGNGSAFSLQTGVFYDAARDSLGVLLPSGPALASDVASKFTVAGNNITITGHDVETFKAFWSDVESTPSRVRLSFVATPRSTGTPSGTASLGSTGTVAVVMTVEEGNPFFPANAGQDIVMFNAVETEPGVSGSAGSGPQHTDRHFNRTAVQDSVDQLSALTAYGFSNLRVAGVGVTVVSMDEDRGAADPTFWDVTDLQVRAA